MTTLEVLAAFHADRELGYPLLSDEDAKHVIGFNVLNEEYEPGHSAHGIPHPGIFYISAEGAVVAKFAVAGVSAKARRWKRCLPRCRPRRADGADRSACRAAPFRRTTNRRNDCAVVGRCLRWRVLQCGWRASAAVGVAEAAGASARLAVSGAEGPSVAACCWWACLHWPVAPPWCLGDGEPGRGLGGGDIGEPRRGCLCGRERRPFCC